MKMRRYISMNGRIVIMAAPFAALFLIMNILPLIMTIYYSFVKSSFDSGFNGISNYMHVWNNSYFQMALSNTIRITCMMICIAIVPSIYLGYLMHTAPNMARAGILIFILPMFLPSSSVTTLWKALFQTSSFTPSLTAHVALISLYVWKYSGVGAVLIKNGFDAIPREIIHAAELDGAGKGRVFFSIMLPAIRREIAVALLLLLMFALRIYKESYLLFGEYPCDSMYLIQHYMNNHFIKLNFQYVAASASSLAGMAVAMYLAVYVAMGRRRRI